MNNQDVLNNIATKILSRAGVDHKNSYSFDPLTILMVISVILTLVRIIQECNKNKLKYGCSSGEKLSLYGEQIKTFSLKRTWFTKMRIKKVLKKYMTKDDYNKYSLAIMNSILDQGETLTDDELQTLVETSNV